METLGIIAVIAPVLGVVLLALLVQLIRRTSWKHECEDLINLFKSKKHGSP